MPFQMHEEAREKALAALLMRARDERENKNEEYKPKSDEGEVEEEEGSSSNGDDSKDDSMDTADIPQMTIKPVEVLPVPPKPLELNIPNAANEISAQ